MMLDVCGKFSNYSCNRLYKIQKSKKLYFIRKRKYKATKYSELHLLIVPNLLNKNFKVENPNIIWVTDISYVRTHKGWLYLVTVKDICTKEIVGWSTADNMKTSLCINVRRYRPEPGLIYYSAREIQYCSSEYQSFLKVNKIICSMSRKGITAMIMNVLKHF